MSAKYFELKVFMHLLPINTDDYCDYEGKKVKSVQPQIDIDRNNVSANFYWKTGELYSDIWAVLGL